MPFERANLEATVVTNLVVTDLEGSVLLELTVQERADGIALTAYSDDKGLLGQASRRMAERS